VTFREIGRATRARGIIVTLDDVEFVSPDGQSVHRDVVRHPGGVGILPVDGADVLLVRQFRAAAGRTMLEIPAGKRDRADESPSELAVRELGEEVGAEAVELVPLGTLLPSPAYTSEVIHLFAAHGLVMIGRRPDGVEEHHAEIVRLPIEQALSMVDEGVIDDAKTQIALYRWVFARPGGANSNPSRVSGGGPTG
jgi:ADP-ribose pyrophosphatase